MSAETWSLARNRVVEASAGTGKTYTITTLVCRLVAEEGVPVRELLVTTFTNSAATELRERIRRRLHALLGELDAGDAPGRMTDALAARWVSEPAELPQRRDRLRQALREMDEAAITTIHGFCQRALQELPFEAGVDIGRELLGDTGALRDVAAADAWASVMAATPPTALNLVSDALPPDATHGLTAAAIEHDDLPVVPAAGRTGGAALAEAVAAVERAVSGMPVARLAPMLKLNNTAGKRFPELGAPAPDGPVEVRAAAWRDRLAWVARVDEDAWGKAVKKEHAAATAEVCACGMELRTVHDGLCGALDALDAQWRAHFALVARASARERKQRERVLTFDDMLHDMHRALQGDAAIALTRAIRTRFRVALVDEFQDTDRVQCEIFEKLFGEGSTRLFFVGDPKQSIYLFRGADIGAYLDATTPPRFQGERAELTTSYRTDRPLVDAVQALLEVEPGGDFGGALADMPGIGLPRLHAVHAGGRLCTAGGVDASALCLVHGEEDPEQPGVPATPMAGEIPARVAEAIREELAAGMQIADGRGGMRALAPGDIAVLVQTNGQVARMQAALRAKRIPSASRSRETVWASAEAVELERMLRAMAAPFSAVQRRAAASTELAGLDADEIRGADAPEAGAMGGAAMERFAEWLLGLRDELEARGPAPCVRSMLDTPVFAARESALLRLLARSGGERTVTNLYHLGELLGAAWRRGVRSAEELALHMASARTAQEDAPAAAESAQQRVESDGNAVQVCTVHSAKGLEWPVVWVPMYALSQGDGTRAYHALATRDGARQVLAVGGRELAAARKARENAELGEQFRLMYVALTRARHRCHVVWLPSYNRGNARTALGATLHGRAEPDWISACAKAGAALASMPHMLGDLEALAARARTGGLQGVVEVRQLPSATRSAWEPPMRDDTLAPARTVRTALPYAARTTSFSGLTRDAHDTVFEPRVRTDDAQGGEAAAAGAAGDAPLLSRDVLPAGPSYGDLVHRILEEGLSCIEENAFLQTVERECLADGTRCSPAELAHGLRSIAEQPLRLADGAVVPLRALGAGRARMELEFLLPAGRANRPVNLHAIARALERGGPTAVRYARVVPTLTPAAFHGHLTGLIDLVCEHAGRWYVLDYKTNSLGPSLDAFTTSALDDAMVANHYVLQYHLYALAVHRWLRSRVPGYHYESHFGGALYLFVRAMGAGRPAGSGVYTDRPSLAVVDALDAAFDGGTA